MTTLKERGGEMGQKFCSSCKNGEINDELAVVEAVVRDPDSGKIVVSGYLCREHWNMYTDDGYKVEWKYLIGVER